MTDRKPPPALDVLLGVPWLEREGFRHAVLLQGVDVADAIVAACRDMADDILKRRAGNTEPFGQKAQIAERAVCINQPEIGSENSNPARQQIESRAFDARGIGEVGCRRSFRVCSSGLCHLRSAPGWKAAMNPNCASSRTTQLRPCPIAWMQL